MLYYHNSDQQLHTTVRDLQYYYHKNHYLLHASDFTGPSSGAWTPPTDQQAVPTFFVQFCPLRIFYTKNIQQLFYMQVTYIYNFSQLLYFLMMDK